MLVILPMNVKGGADKYLFKKRALGDKVENYKVLGTHSAGH